MLDRRSNVSDRRLKMQGPDPRGPARALLAALVVWGAASAPATASGGQDAALELYYKVYIGGFHALDLDVDIDLDPARYDVNAHFRTTGTVGSLLPWWMKAYSRGALVDGRVTPAEAGQKNTWRGRERYLDMTFRNGLAEISKIKPPPARDERDRVPPRMRRGVLDLASAILRAIRTIEDRGACAARIPVFDGRRRYDFVLEPEGRDTLRASRYSPFSGEALTCIASIDRKAGFKDFEDHDVYAEDGGRRHRYDRRARVWMGAAFENLPPVPVRVSIDTRFGALYAHLNRATATRAGQRMRLGGG